MNFTIPTRTKQLRSSSAIDLGLMVHSAIGNGMSQGLKEEPGLFTGEGSGLVLERPTAIVTNMYHV